MSINPEAEAHLREERRELLEQREQLDREIAQLDSKLQGYGGKPTADVDPVKAELINPQHI